ncbi:hypothetical protein BgiMline_017495 [Biomphalaria glabrata]
MWHKGMTILVPFSVINNATAPWCECYSANCANSAKAQCIKMKTHYWVLSNIAFKSSRSQSGTDARVLKRPTGMSEYIAWNETQAGHW